MCWLPFRSSNLRAIRPLSTSSGLGRLSLRALGTTACMCIWARSHSTQCSHEAYRVRADLLLCALCALGTGRVAGGLVQ